MTAYRYVRQGRLVATRDGTEWRVAAEDLKAFKSAATRAVAPETEAPAPGQGAPWAKRLERCLLAGDETAAWRIIEQALASGRSVQYCYLEMLAGALSAIGEGWARGQLDVADQHLATAVAARLVSRLGARFRRPGRSRGTVVFGAPTGEFHSLPIAIASDLVRLQGFDVLELGANVPAEAFVSAALSAPRLIAIGVGVTQRELIWAAQEVIDAVRAADPTVPVILGGLAAGAVADMDLRGVTAVAADGSSAVALIESFAASRAMRSVG